MIACLQVVDDLRIEQLLSKDADDLFAEIEEMQEDNDSVLDIDKLWDGLHFLLTGVSACEPIEGNLISEAIVGTRKFIEDEDTDHIAYIPYERVRAIAKELNGIDINDVVEGFQPKKFAQSGIYPNIWMNESKESLKKIMKDCFIELKTFYDKTADKKKGIIISIY